MEITFKIVLDKRRVKRNQTFSLKTRVYQGQTYRTNSLGIDLRDADWNDQLQEVKKCNSNHRLYNLKINALKSKVQKSIFLVSIQTFGLLPKIYPPSYSELQLLLENGRRKENKHH